LKRENNRKREDWIEASKTVWYLERLDDRSRMSGDVHVRFCERLRGKFPRATRLIVTGKSKRLLEQQVRPAIETFLAERGLKLSEEKTAITHITSGFTFLGQTFRKKGNGLHITPSKEGILSLKLKVGNLIRQHVSRPMPALVKALNQTLRGWGNYHRHVVSSEAFSHVDTYVYEQLWRMLRKRHPQKSRKWLRKKYWPTGQNGFKVQAKTKKGLSSYQVVRLSSIGIRRHIKIKAAANPYDPDFSAYIWNRRNNKEARLFSALSAREYRQSTQSC